MDKGKTQPTRFATTVVERNEAPQLLTAEPVTRKRTPVGMPAPPSSRGSHDDIERVLEQEKSDRERAQLLVKNQELEQENARLRKEGRTEVFPPVSVPPPPATPKIVTPMLSSAPPVDIKALKKAVEGSPLGRYATRAGLALAIAWNAFNSARATVPLQKAEATQARQTQLEQNSEATIQQRILEQQRTLQALRALECWGKQTRGGFQRQGLDLQSLPSGGIKALRLGDDDPNRPGPPRFVAEEKCPDFPKLPPDGTAR